MIERISITLNKFGVRLKTFPYLLPKVSWPPPAHTQSKLATSKTEKALNMYWSLNYVQALSGRAIIHKTHRTDIVCRGVFAASLQPGSWGQPLGPALVFQLAWKRSWLGFLLVQAISWGLLSEPWFSVITATALAWRTNWSEWLEWKISKPLLCLALLLFAYNRIWGIFEGIIKHKTQCLALKTTLQHYLDPFAKEVSFFISVMGYLPA